MSVSTRVIISCCCIIVVVALTFFLGHNFTPAAPDNRNSLARDEIIDRQRLRIKELEQSKQSSTLEASLNARIKELTQQVDTLTAALRDAGEPRREADSSLSATEKPTATPAEHVESSSLERKDTDECVSPEQLEALKLREKMLLADVKSSLKAQARKACESDGHEAGIQKIPFEQFCGDELRKYDFSDQMGVEKADDRYHWLHKLRGQLDQKKAGPNERALLRDKRWWCDKLAIDGALPPVPPAPTLPCDSTGLVVGLMTGDNVAYSRASAMRDTWLQRCNTTYMFTVHTNPSLPSIGLKDVYPDEFKGDAEFLLGQAGRDPVGEINMFGLRYMYEHHPEAKWYWMSACDIWVDVAQFLLELGQYDPDTEGFLMPSIFPHNFTAIPGGNLGYLESVGEHYKDTWKSKPVFYWTSGGSGLLYSRKTLGILMEDFSVVERFRSYLPNGHLGRPCDAETPALLTFLGHMPTEMRAPQLPMKIMAADPFAGSRRDASLTLSHYISPFRALSLDQWSTHNKIERMAAHGEAERLVAYFKEFVDDTYASLRRRMIDMRFVTETSRGGSEKRELLMSSQWEDIPSLYNVGAASQIDPEIEQICKKRLEALALNH